MSLAVDVVARGRLEYAVFRHHGHEGLDVMTIPGVSERLEQRLQISICHRSRQGIARGTLGLRIGVEEDVEVAGCVTKQPEKQRDLPPMMNAVDHRMLHQFSKARCVLQTVGKRPLNNSIEIFVAKPRQELAHVSLDLPPSFANRCHGWVIRGFESRATRWRPATPAQPAPLSTENVDQRVPYRTIASSHWLNKLFVRQLREHVEDLSICPVAVVELRLKILDGHFALVTFVPSELSADAMRLSRAPFASTATYG